MVVEIKFPPIFDPIKAHVGRHKVAYSVGTGVVIAGITCVIMRSTTALGEVGGRAALGEASNTASFSFGKNAKLHKVNLINVVQREGRGHPGYPTMNVETGHTTFSITDMANDFNIPNGRLRGHLKGKYPDVDGLHFKNVNLTPTV